MRLQFIDKNLLKKWTISVRFFSISISKNDEIILNIDRAGRIISFISNNGSPKKITYKRSFDGNFLSIIRNKSSEKRVRVWIDSKQNLKLLSEVKTFIKEFENIISEKPVSHSFEQTDKLKNSSMDQVIDLIRVFIENCKNKSIKVDKDNFNKVYSNIGILPPDRYGSLILQVTTGCSYNQCAFCTLYRNIKFSYKSIQEFSHHINQVKAFMGESLGRFHSIFLGDANALTIPFSILKQNFNRIHEEFEFINRESQESMMFKNRPTFNGIYSFLDVFTGFKLAQEELIQLKNLKLKMVYLGIESGSKDVLKLVNKPNIPEKMFSLIKKLQIANISVGVIFIVGLGGKEFASNHLQETTRLIQKMDLNSEKDVIFLSKIVVNEMLQEKNSISNNFSENELDFEFSKFKESINQIFNSKPKPIRIINYSIREFIY